MAEKVKKDRVCGIVMPIASMDDCPETHWAEVKQIIVSVVDDLGYECKLVSEETDVGVIQKRIVQNLYDNDLIICDVSCRNANVMFELGMRLAFDKPVILIKDDKTPYSFDTSPVEHLTYRRDLRFSSINDFKDKLKAKIISVLSGDNTSSFLSSFGSFKIAELKTESVGPYELLIDEIAALRRIISPNRPELNWQEPKYYGARHRTNMGVHEMIVYRKDRSILLECSGGMSAIRNMVNTLHALPGVEKVATTQVREKFSIRLSVKEDVSFDDFLPMLVEVVSPEFVMEEQGVPKKDKG